MVWVGFRADEAEATSASLGSATSTPLQPQPSEKGASSEKANDTDASLFSLQATHVKEINEKDTDAAQTYTQQSQPKLQSKQQQLIYFDMKKLKDAVADLNSLVEEGGAKVINENGVYKFKQGGEAIHLKIFKDGMFYQNGPLRPYAMPEARAFIKVGF